MKTGENFHEVMKIFMGFHKRRVGFHEGWVFASLRSKWLIVNGGGKVPKVWEIGGLHLLMDRCNFINVGCE